MPDAAAGPVDQHPLPGLHRATIAERKLTGEEWIRVHRVVCVVDCGQPVNPLGIEAQGFCVIGPRSAPGG